MESFIKHLELYNWKEYEKDNHCGNVYYKNRLSKYIIKIVLNEKVVVLQGILVIDEFSKDEIHIAERLLKFLTK